MPSSQKRPRKSVPAPQSAKKSEPTPRAATTKIIRRVEAVIHVKQEGDSDEEDLSLSPNATQHPLAASMPIRDVARSSNHYDAQRQNGHVQRPRASGSRGRQRASRSRVIHDDDEDEEDEEAEQDADHGGVYRSQSEGSVSDDEEEEVYAATAYNPPSSGRLRNLSRINYREEDDDDEDELTMGAEVCISYSH